MNEYLIIHQHEYGNTTFRVNTNRILGIDNTDEIVDTLKIDYEPMKGETIEIIKLDEDNCDVVWMD